MDYLHLKRYGLTREWEEEAATYRDLFPGRVTEQHRDLYRIMSEDGELLGEVSGKLAYQATEGTDFPAVGDWVLLDRADGVSGRGVIHRILSRRSAFVRRAAGTARETQIVAANVDLVFLCMALHGDFNLRRLERYLSVAWGSGATPVVVLTKSDLCDDLPARVAEVESVSSGAEVRACSSLQEEGYDQVLRGIPPRATVAFLGSSGVGKSTLINRLMGEEVLATGEIREDDGRGRHTTTHRQLLRLPCGVLVIDTPGMRELQLDSGDLSRSFDDIQELAARCRFPDCSHRTEPGCAVREALERGDLSPKRLESFEKLRREMDYAALDARGREREKIRHMFGSLGEMKQMVRQAKRKNRR